MIKTTISLIIIFFLSSCSKNYLKEYNITDARKKELELKLSLDDKRYIFQSILYENLVPPDLYFTDTYLIKTCQQKYKIDELYSIEDAHKYIKKEYASVGIDYDKTILKIILLRLHDFKFYLNIFYAFKDFIIVIFGLILFLIFWVTYKTFIKIKFQNFSIQNEKKELKRIKNKLNKKEIDLLNKEQDCNLRTEKIKISNQLIKELPNLQNKSKNLHIEIENAKSDLQNIKIDFENIYETKINKIKNDLQKSSDQRQYIFEEDCKNKYNLNQIIENEKKELKEYLQAINKNKDRILKNPNNNDQIFKLFKKIEKLFHYLK